MARRAGDRPLKGPCEQAGAVQMHNGSYVILIAERDARVRELQKFFLDRAGYTVIFADDGEAALDKRTRRPLQQHPASSRSGA
jgi:hypothetical protein